MSSDLMTEPAAGVSEAPAFNHFAISVTDCEAAVEWYNRVLNMRQLCPIRTIPGQYITSDSMFGLSGKPLEAIKIAFIGDQRATGAVEILEFIRANPEEASAGNITKPDVSHLALTVSNPEQLACAISEAGGARVGSSGKLPSGVVFAQCLDPWDNAIELMSGPLEDALKG